MRPRLLSLAFASAGLGACGEAPLPPLPPVLSVPPLAAGMRLTIAPNLPDVFADDLPETTQRVVEVVSLEGGRLRLRWTGSVRRESAESAERRAAWLRVRSNAKSGEEPPPPAPPRFEEASVTGTLDFPDFEKARALLLPGLWPEGRALMRDSSGLWLGPAALKEALGERRARVPFMKGRSLRDPAAALLDRATEMVRGCEPLEGEEWRLLPGRGRSSLLVNGVAGEVSTVRLASWFGTLEVIPDAENPLVVAVDPSPSSAGLVTPFAPARVLKALLSYRVTAVSAAGSRR